MSLHFRGFGGLHMGVWRRETDTNPVLGAETTRGLQWPNPKLHISGRPTAAQSPLHPLENDGATVRPPRLLVVLGVNAPRHAGRSRQRSRDDPRQAPRETAWIYRLLAIGDLRFVEQQPCHIRPEVRVCVTKGG